MHQSGDAGAGIPSNVYVDWVFDRAFMLVPVPAPAFVAEHLPTLVEFPSRQEPASFGIDQVMKMPRAGITRS